MSTRPSATRLYWRILLVLLYASELDYLAGGFMDIVAALGQEESKRF